MSYFKDTEQWLDKVLSPLPKEKRAEAIQSIKSKLLESYRNGERAGKRDEKTAPTGRGARHDKTFRVVIREEHFQTYLVKAGGESEAEEKVKAAIADGSLWDGAYEIDANSDYHAENWEVVDAESQP